MKKQTDNTEYTPFPKKRTRKPNIKKTTLPEAMKLFEAALIEEGKSEITIKNYIADLRGFVAWLDKKKDLILKDSTILESAGQSFVQFATSIKKSPKYAPTTTNRRIISIRKFFEFLYEDKYITTKYGNNITMKKVQGGNQGAVKWLKREEVDKIIESIPQLYRITPDRIARNRAIILVLVNCGLRVKELTDLRVGDIDFTTGVLTVRDGKGGKFRQVPITEGTMAAVRGSLSFGGAVDEELHLPKDSYVFVAERNNTTNMKFSERGVQHLTQNLSKLSGVEFSPHTLRHTYCKQIADATGKIQLVAELAGHSNINTTRIYTTPSKEELTKVIEGIEFK